MKHFQIKVVKFDDRIIKYVKDKSMLESLIVDGLGIAFWLCFLQILNKCVKNELDKFIQAGDYPSVRLICGLAMII